MVVLADRLSVVWVVDLGVFALVAVAMMALAAAAGACACWCSRTADAGAGRGRGPGAEEEEGVQAGKPAKKSKAKKGRMETGVQGPVHYDGKRYVHRNQGFSRGDEVTHHLPARPHFD